MRRDTSNIYPLYRRVKKANEDLNVLYEKAIAQSNSLANSATSEKRELADVLSKRELEVRQKEMDLLAAQRTLLDKEQAATKLQAEAERLKSEAEKLKLESSQLKEQSGKLQGNLDQTTATLAQREQRVKELESVIAAQKAKSDELKQKLSSALTGFSSNELTVTQRDGKVYVSLSQELLFASGSTEVNQKGRAAISSLASVLNKNSDIQVMVEGHTDNVPFKGAGAMKDNWDLSAIRATAITKLLVNGGVTPQRIAAAGRGEYLPVSDNSTSDGKAKNRRTEIILSPKLDDLYNIIKN